MTDQESGAQGERPLSDEERAELYREQLKKLHVIDLVRDMMVTLVTVGYEKLGLTGQTRELRDLGDARVAIESLRRLIEVIEGEGDPEAASLRSTLAQMQLSFARAAAEPPRGDAAAPAEPSQPGSGAEGRSEAESQPRVETETEPAIAHSGTSSPDGAARTSGTAKKASDGAARTSATAKKARDGAARTSRKASEKGEPGSAAARSAPKQAAPGKAAPRKAAPRKPAAKRSTPRKPPAK